MSTLEQVASPALLRAVGFVLLHSLWQGAALALVVALLLPLLRQQAALVRYRLAAVALLALVALAAITLGYYYQTGPVPTGPAGPQTVSQPVYAAAVALAHQQRSAPPLGSWQWVLKATTGYLEQHLHVVVALWLLGFTIMMGRLLLALTYVQRLRRRRVSAVPAAWQQCLARLTARAGLASGVQLRASALVPSPLVIGYFKPVILLPLGVLSGLTAAELEMILAHELAHIIRKDYLFNFGQSVAETIFFYHPAVWFISGVLHAERENCCDDLATQLGGNPRQLARALAALAELTHFAAPVPRLALAAVGSSGSLLSRVQRLVHRPPAKTTGLWPASLALLGAGLLLGGVLFSTQAARRQPWHTTLTRIRSAATTKNTPDNAPHTGRAPLATSDNEIQALFQRQLQADALLPNADRYALSLTAAQFLVNHQAQPAAVRARYQRLYEAATGFRMTATTTYYTEQAVTYQVARTALAAKAAPKPGTAIEHAALLRQLHHDGLLAPGAHTFRVELTKAGTFLVNGQPQPAQRLATYRPLLPLPDEPAGRSIAAVITVH